MTCKRCCTRCGQSCRKTYWESALIPRKTSCTTLPCCSKARPRCSCWAWHCSLWRWRHPAAFLMLLSGLGVLFVGGTLVLYPNSSPPMPAHWTPAFPAFFAAIAVPIGAWVGTTDPWLRRRWRWITPAILVVALADVGLRQHRLLLPQILRGPVTLKSKHYKSSQILYEEQTLQSRYMASLGPGYRVIVVGQFAVSLRSRDDAVSCPGTGIHPDKRPATGSFRWVPHGKGFGVSVLPGNEQYREIIRERYPGGTESEVRNPVGKHLLHTYVVKPE